MKKMSATDFESIAPGRLCLFGEHQDYLGLPVIAVALPLSCRIHVTRRNDRILRLYGPASSASASGTTGTTLIREYNLDCLPARQSSEKPINNPDFALAAIHEVLEGEEGLLSWSFLSGADCVSTSELPMQGGCSSSSAFLVAWIQVLATLCNQTLTSPIQVAKLAHRAEVVHFGAPGGNMDHMTSALGGLLRIGSSSSSSSCDMWSYESLSFASSHLGVWVLAYSGQPKETIRHLQRCKEARLRLWERLGGDWDATTNDKSLSDEDLVLLHATRVNRDTEAQAAELFKSGDSKDLGKRLGYLMKQHHEALRDGLGLSTERLEAMNNAALQAGAWGFKVVGSGGGGCAVAWTHENNAANVAEAMKRAGAPQTWIILEPAKGARIV